MEALERVVDDSARCHPRAVMTLAAESGAALGAHAGLIGLAALWAAGRVRSGLRV